MFRQVLVVGSLAMSLAACAAAGAPGQSSLAIGAPEFGHRVATSELVLFWNCLQPEPGLLRVAGEAQNPWQAQPVGYLEFDLVGVDANERTTAQTTAVARDLEIRTNQRSPFQLDLRTTGTEVRYDLYYQYRFYEEFDTSALVAWPPVAGPGLLAQTQTAVARDVCSSTQHRAR
jgi:NADPH-dependent 2,4-dienoyl-CoA reductase/sulfur reductase-like enzyme